MKKTLFFILILCCLKIKAQNFRKFLYADIKDEIGLVYNAHIINLTTKQGTFTNENGEFRILAKANDSLKISFVGYKSIRIKVAKKYFGIKKTVFNLVKTTYELDEVTIKKSNLLGFLSADSKNIKPQHEVTAKTLELPYAGSRIMTPAERKLHTAMGGSNPFTVGLANAVSLDYILNSISGRIKKLRKLKTIEDLETKIIHIKNIYSKHIVKDFKIKETDVYKFIYFCSTDGKFDKTYNAGEINMIVFLKSKVKIFKKLNLNDYN